MSAGRIEVFVNDRKVSIYAGMQVQHALIACDPDLYTAACARRLRIVDENGFQIGLEGEVHHGSKIYTKPVRDA